jgi:kynurenine formamidase
MVDRRMALGACALAALALAAPACAQGEPRSALVAPARWGAEDQAGASNTQTPEKARQAAALITEGNSYPLARTFEAGMPLYGARVFAVRGTGAVALGPFGENGVTFNDDFIAGEINQIGSQFDALGHAGVWGPDGPVYYGGRTADQVHAPNGLAALGVEQVKPFFTRGILVDVEAFRGGMLDAGDEVTVADIEGALAAQGVDPASISEGDVVLIHTGWGRLWGVDNARFMAGEPGIGLAAAVWLADKGVALIGGDSTAVEVQPGPDPSVAAPVHQELLVRRGVFILENAATERLADAGVSEFAFSFAPVPFKGATGAPGAALAIR